MMGPIEAAAPDCVSFAEPKARVPHACCECGKTIEPGEKYERVSGIWEGKPARFKTCAACRDLRHRFCRHVEYEYNPPFGFLRECMLASEVTEEDLPCLSRP